MTDWAHTASSPIPYDGPLERFGPVPDGWIWGAATAAHQIEGANVGSDWWEWEHRPGTRCKESSGDACDSWHRWREDLAVAVELGLDSYRISIEWARIEPAEGEFSAAALAHYRAFLEEAHRLGLKNCVTFHHFTTPAWVDKRGGWSNPEVVGLFRRYCEAAVAALGDLIDMACTINEANLPGLLGYLIGEFAPGVSGDVEAFRAVQRNFADAHVAAREALRAGPGEFPIGMTLALSDTVVHPDGEWDGPGLRADGAGRWVDGDGNVAEMRAEDAQFAHLMSGMFYEVAAGDDFIGVQTYMTQHVDAAGTPLTVPEGERVTQMGWTFTPEALGATVRVAAAATGLPVYVTENGVATTDCNDRIEYLTRSLGALRAAMDDGVDVRGFFAWSLLDNFEWAYGYGPKFGLVAVDRTTFERRVKDSGRWYAGLIANSR